MLARSFESFDCEHIILVPDNEVPDNEVPDNDVPDKKFKTFIFISILREINLK